jgi:hypothetical protein
VLADSSRAWTLTRQVSTPFGDIFDDLIELIVERNPDFYEAATVLAPYAHYERTKLSSSLLLIT